MLLDAGVKTNIHYVLGQNSIDEAIERLRGTIFPRASMQLSFSSINLPDRGPGKMYLRRRIQG